MKLKGKMSAPDIIEHVKNVVDSFKPTTKDVKKIIANMQGRRG
jgi:hypothetical protein